MRCCCQPALVSFQMARLPPPPSGLLDAPLLGFLAPSTAFGLLRPQAYCSLMSDVRFTTLPSVRSPTDVTLSNQTVAGTRRNIPAVRYTLRRLAPRRQQNRLTTFLAFLPFTTNDAALIPSSKNDASVDVSSSIPKGTASDLNALCSLLCHRHRRLGVLSVAGRSHPHDASEHSIASAKQGIASLSKPLHLSAVSGLFPVVRYAQWLSESLLRFSNRDASSPLGFREMRSYVVAKLPWFRPSYEHDLGSFDSVAKAEAFSDA